MYTCRECEQVINQASEICPYCGADLTETPEDAGPANRKANPARLVLIWGAVIVSLWTIVWFVLPPRSGNPAAQAEGSALDSLRQIRAALAAYAAAEGGYPPSLESIADRVRGAAQRAQGEGYQFFYTPGGSGADGRIHSYVLQARGSNYGYRSFYADETGVLRATREDRPASAQDPPL